MASTGGSLQGGQIICSMVAVHSDLHQNYGPFKGAPVEFSVQTGRLLGGSRARANGHGPPGMPPPGHRHAWRCVGRLLSSVHRNAAAQQGGTWALSNG